MRDIYDLTSTEAVLPRLDRDGRTYRPTHLLISLHLSIYSVYQPTTGDTYIHRPASY